ncbi:retrovirus-related pol polyprotein from transposon TNT 1-94 [Tanacetum coccineum]|uniref:Retrovirus-related pol polyprotein from transposon TNT 1-94 n=1 Tax=Tanacetum coccineum TaxID=301880 RepID=A0ABQ5JGD7_9ASTR
MANISNYGSDVISEVPHSKTYLNDMENQSVHAMQDFEQPPAVDFTKNEIHSDSNIITYSQYFQETQQANDQDTHLQAQQDSMILFVTKQMSQQMINHVNNWEKANKEHNNESITAELESKPFDASLVKIEAPKELPKVSLVNESLKKLKFHLARFDNVVKTRTTPDVRTEDTCPNAIKLSAKKVDITPKNNVKKVKLVEPLTSSRNIKQVESSTTSDSNTPVLSSTRLKCSTSKCGSKPTSNKKNDRISRTPSRNMKNKVEAQPRKVNKKNRVVEPICDVNVKHSLLNANSEPICATCKKSLFDDVHDKGVDLLSGSRDTNLYTISLDDMLKTSPICLLSKASKTKSWLWHHRLSHLNFGTLNKLAKDGLARGIPRLKFQKDHLCSACALGKGKKSSHQPKAEDINQEKLYLLYMDLYGPMRVASINGKRYILVIVDDYSRFTWVRFLRTKDEAPEAIIKCIKNIQVRLNATVRNVRTYNGTEFVNQTLREFYKNVGISHQTSVARTPQQNDFVER